MPGLPDPGDLIVHMAGMLLCDQEKALAELLGVELKLGRGGTTQHLHLLLDAHQLEGSKDLKWAS